MCFFGSKTGSQVLANKVGVLSHLDSENYAGDFFTQNQFHDVPYFKPGFGIDVLKGKLCMDGEIDYALHFIGTAAL